MLLKKIFFLLLILINFPAFSYTTDQVEHLTYKECENNMEWQDTTLGRRICTDIGIKEKDKELNILYKKILSKESLKKQKELRAAQRTWLKYRKAWCEYTSPINEMSGSEAPGMRLLCYLGELNSRVHKLKEILKTIDNH